MTIYVVFGGMLATSWVQKIKTILLLSGTFLLALTVFSKFNWNIFNLIDEVKLETPLGNQIFIPGQLLSNPLEVLSLYLALIFGTAGLPHFLIRFYTVKNAIEVRKSVLTASWIIGVLYLMTFVLGFGTTAVIGYDTLINADSTGNLAAPLLAKDFNVAQLVTYAFAVGASANLPVIIFSIYGKRFNTPGAVAAMLSSTTITVLLIFVGPEIMGENALFPLTNAGIVSILAGFIIAVVVSLLTKPEDKDKVFAEMSVRSHTGIGAE